VINTPTGLNEFLKGFTVSSIYVCTAEKFDTPSTDNGAYLSQVSKID
jgi:uncharacterized membrane protein (DUF485 family)